MLDRRTFISHSAVISAAMAALRNTPAVADEPATSRPIGSGETVRVAIVGLGGRGGDHIKGLTGNFGCEVVAICDADSKAAGNAMRAIAKKQKTEPKFYQDMRKLLEDKSIDAVSFATPNHWHALGAIWAMQAGKHVYSEKPASHNVLEGRRMIEAARKYKLICQVGTQSRSMPGMRDAMAYVHDGKLGKVKLSYGTCYKRRKSIGDVGRKKGEQQVPDSVDYDLWCGPARKLPVMREKFHYDWHWFWEYGNGDLGNQGVHEMDKARWGLQKNELPRSVVSFGGRFGYLDDGETANTQLAVFDYGDGELVFEVRGLETDSPYPGKLGGKRGSGFVGNVYYGDKGILVCPSYTGGVVLDPDLKEVTRFQSKDDGQHYENFVKAIRSGKYTDLNCDVSEGHLSAALCHLANISLRLGKQMPVGELKEIAGSKEANEILKKMFAHLKETKKEVELSETPCFYGPLLPIDPKKEQFTGNNEKANSMLTREYRKGFEITDKV
ncbi:MAG TPA: Gfo/Idh/MocA family oxidoreductase [Gemmataceae bacterium]|nr:Gfo/Idh/MocA family oxidoreductase [Gemmataceae bacterium]